MEQLALEFALRSGLIVLTAAVVLRVLRIRAAAAQHTVWVGVLVVMLALPLWISWGPKASLAVLPARDASPRVMTALSTSGNPTATVSMPLELSEPSIVASTRNGGAIHWNWNTIGLAAYLLGAIALLLRLAIGTVRANRLTSASCAAPVTVGLLHPRVILPECAGAWPQAQLDAVTGSRATRTCGAVIRWSCGWLCSIERCSGFIRLRGGWNEGSRRWRRKPATRR